MTLSADSAASPEVTMTGSSATKPRFSFEVFPARSGAAALALGKAVQFLAQAGPDFISVTYGANGSHRDASRDLLRYLRQHTSVLPMAHLTTVNTPAEQLRSTVRELLDDGIYDFLALRGDVPKGMDPTDPGVTGSLRSKALVQLIQEVRAERPPHTTVGRTAVAAYPTGHPAAESWRADLDWLKQKQDAGAAFAITQLFFYASDYERFCERAQNAGVTMPILPGIMPVATAAQLTKVGQLSRQDPPAELLEKMERAGGFAPELGVEYATRLCEQVIAAGAPSLHLYTFNRHEQVLRVLRELGIVEAW